MVTEKISMCKLSMRLLSYTLFFAVFFSLNILPFESAFAYSPQSPEVQAMVAKAVGFLDTAEEQRLGGKCLIALAIYKNGAEQNHPSIVSAIERCQQFCRKDLEKSTENIYSIGLAIIYLCEIDAVAYRPEIEKLLKLLVFRQKPHGGFGYRVLTDNSPSPQGDTSMTQYAVLGTWTAKRHGVDV